MREDGNQDACALYGKVLKENNKPQQAIKLYKQACDKGSARGCELLGDYYEIRSKQAYFYANKACEIDKQRCLLLGGILYFEDKFVQSFKAAEKSCYSQKYYISSCLMAAMAYENKLKNFMKSQRNYTLLFVSERRIEKKTFVPRLGNCRAILTCVVAFAHKRIGTRLFKFTILYLP